MTATATTTATATRVRPGAGLVAGALLLVGCHATPDAVPTAAPSTAAVGVVRTGDGLSADGPLHVEIPPIVVDGDHAVLTLRFTTSAGSTVSVGKQLAAPGGLGVGAVRLVDLTGSRVWLPGRDPSGRLAASSEFLWVRGGGAVTASVLTAVPGVTAVDVLLPVIGLVTDVQVVTPAAGETASPVVTAADLGLASVTYPGPVPLQSYVDADDRSLSVVADRDGQSVRLSADVLFEPGSANLTSAGRALVAQVGAQLGTVTGGVVQVDGYTDAAVGAQSLTELQAGVVAQALRGEVGSDVAVTPTGHGTAAPLLVAPSPAQADVDRAVVVRWSGTAALVPSALATDTSSPSPSAEADAVAPPAAGAAGAGTPTASPAVAASTGASGTAPPAPDASGSAAASSTSTVATGDRPAALGPDFALSVQALTARGGWWVGRLVLTRTAGGGAVPAGLLGDPAEVREPYDPDDLPDGVWALTLVDGTARLHPAQHVADPAASDVVSGAATGSTAPSTPAAAGTATAPGSTPGTGSSVAPVTVLGDRYGSDGDLAIGSSVTLTVIWPAPTSGSVGLAVGGRLLVEDLTAGAA